MRFEWNPVKASKNRKKHGVDFADAVSARRATGRERRQYESKS